jgi:hypothetical protein
MAGHVCTATLEAIATIEVIMPTITVTINMIDVDGKKGIYPKRDKVVQ